jgi:DNA-binding Xre family transcriptional regulator
MQQKSIDNYFYVCYGKHGWFVNESPAPKKGGYKMFPELAKLMAYKHINQKGLAKILGISWQAVSKKLSGKTDFKRREMIAIKKYFLDICPNLTIDTLFREDIFLSG